MWGAGKSVLEKGLDAFAQRNWKRARQLLQDAALDAPSPNGDYHLALLLWRGLGGPREADGAVDLFKRAAREGHVAAQTAFGLALAAGAGVKQDLDEARKVLRAAAGGDDVEAMFQLAQLSGPEEARRWLERAAELGSPAAMMLLSDLLVAEEPVQALAWIYAGAALSPDDALRKRAAAIAHEMTAVEIDAAQRAGRAHLRMLRHQNR